MTGAVGMPMVPSTRQQPTPIQSNSNRSPSPSIHPRWFPLSCVDSPSFGQSINQSIHRSSPTASNPSIHQLVEPLTHSASLRKSVSILLPQANQTTGLNISQSSPLVNMSRATSGDMVPPERPPRGYHHPLHKSPQPLHKACPTNLSERGALPQDTHGG